MRKCPVCRTCCETHKGNEEKTAFCTFFSLISAGTWNRRREIFSSRMCIAGGGGGGAELLGCWRPSGAGPPACRGTATSAMSPGGARSLGVPGCCGGWSNVSPRGRRGTDGGGWQEIPAAPPRPRQAQQRGACSQGGRGGRSLRGTHGPLFLEHGAEIQLGPWCDAAVLWARVVSGTEELPVWVRMGMGQTQRPVAELHVPAVGQAPRGLARSLARA